MRYFAEGTEASAPENDHVYWPFILLYRKIKTCQGNIFGETQSLLVSEFFVVFFALAGGAEPLDLPGAPVDDEVVLDAVALLLAAASCLPLHFVEYFGRIHLGVGFEPVRKLKSFVLRSWQPKSQIIIYFKILI